jgi:hypothetical protein
MRNLAGVFIDENKATDKAFEIIDQDANEEVDL